MSKARDLASGQNGIRPYATAAGVALVTGSATITFPANRFTQNPLMTLGVFTTNGTRWGASNGTTSTTGVTLYNWNGTVAGTAQVGMSWTAIQMTSDNRDG
jgi:hypothetical protein